MFHEFRKVVHVARHCRTLAITALPSPGIFGVQYHVFPLSLSIMPPVRIYSEESTMTVSIFIGVSVDGFIARPNGDLDFLPPGGGEPHGYDEFMASVDALVIGRKTFETVLNFAAWGPMVKNASWS